uniref:Uncharacterized protein n=1 Tax=Plectus sambesii TaxID=2011161 RepID=A0A914UP27_9BILA
MAISMKGGAVDDEGQRVAEIQWNPSFRRRRRTIVRVETEGIIADDRRFKAIRRRVSARRTARRRFLRLVGPGRDRWCSADIDILRTNDLRPIVAIVGYLAGRLSRERPTTTPLSVFFLRRRRTLGSIAARSFRRRMTLAFVQLSAVFLALLRFNMVLRVCACRCHHCCMLASADCNFIFYAFLALPMGNNAAVLFGMVLRLQLFAHAPPVLGCVRITSALLVLRFLLQALPRNSIRVRHASERAVYCKRPFMAAINALVVVTQKRCSAIVHPVVGLAF